MNLARLVYGAWLTTARRHHRSLLRALRRPEEAQLRVLKRILGRNRRSRVGRRLGFAGIDSPEAFRRRVPLVRYDDLRGDIEDLCQGETGVLTSEPVRRLVPSSGSTGDRKLIPFTTSLGRDFARGVGAWMVDLARRHPEIRSGPAYWSVSPAMDLPAEPSAVPIGFDDDAAYLGRWLEPLVARTLIAPSALRHARPLSAFQYATLRLLLGARRLRLISIWHPSFLTLLLDARKALWSRLLRDLHDGTLSPDPPLEEAARRRLTGAFRADPRRARELERLGPEADPGRLWPELAVVSAWAGGAARGPFEALRRRLGGVALQPKGILATEAFVSLPFEGLHPFALRSAYFELLDEAGRIRGVHEARDGGAYEIVLTTSGGLYRYRLGDRVVVDGRVAGTPSIRLVGRGDRVVDQVGEKISEGFVGEALRRAFGSCDLPPFALLAPEGDRYLLFLSQPPAAPETFTSRLTEALRANPGFAYAQDLGQLGPVEVLLTAPDAEERYLRYLEGRGRVFGEIKPTHLEQEGPWREVLEASPLPPPSAPRPPAALTYP